MKDPTLKFSLDHRTIDQLETLAMQRNVTMAALIRGAVQTFVNNTISQENGINASTNRK